MPNISSNLIARFWEKVDKNGPIPDHVPEIGECWQWTGRPTGTGCGQISEGSEFDRHTWNAYVLSWVIHFGATNGLGVLHRCDNRMCVRPAHLFLSTAADNIHYMMRKGRQRIINVTADARRAATACLKCDTPYDADNTYWHSGKRNCRNCSKLRERVYRERRRNI